MTRRTPSNPRPPKPEARPERKESSALPNAGEHLWTTRETYEDDLREELSKEPSVRSVRVLERGLVASRGAPAEPSAFARQGFLVSSVVRSEKPSELDTAVTKALYEAFSKAGALDAPWALHVWVADTERANRMARNAEVLARAVELRALAVSAPWADRRVASAHLARASDGWLAQVCVLEPGVAAVGVGLAAQAPSLHPGGRARMRVDDSAPSRAAMKLEEALDWLGVGPAAGECCADLGAAPGGWTWVVLGRGARVIAVDPGSLTPELTADRRVTHLRGSAFDYEPDEPIDWLLCDMVWRPLEVAALLGKWARRRWARMLVANLKLPMKSKVEFVGRVKALLEQGGWREVRVRQLYHDREEVTVTAHTSR